MDGGDVLVFFNDTATTEIYTLSLHDALPILRHEVRDPVEGQRRRRRVVRVADEDHARGDGDLAQHGVEVVLEGGIERDRKSTRLNSSHANISYAVFCLKKKTHLHFCLALILV